MPKKFYFCIWCASNLSRRFGIESDQPIHAPVMRYPLLTPQNLIGFLLIAFSIYPYFSKFALPAIRFVAIKHGAFAGGFIGSLIGAFGTIIAGYWAWDGVQAQVTQQNASNKIAVLTLLRSERDELYKQYAFAGKIDDLIGEIEDKLSPELTDLWEKTEDGYTIEGLHKGLSQFLIEHRDDIESLTSSNAGLDGDNVYRRIMSIKFYLSLVRNNEERAKDYKNAGQTDHYLTSLSNIEELLVKAKFDLKRMIDMRDRFGEINLRKMKDILNVETQIRKIKEIDNNQ